jgi:hypothetical protein
MIFFSKKYVNVQVNRQDSQDTPFHQGPGSNQRKSEERPGYAEKIQAFRARNPGYHGDLLQA